MIILLMFLIGGPLLFLCCEYLARNIENIYTKKYDYLNEQKNEIVNLAIGSSHPLYAINPEFFTDKTYNVSLVSQSLSYNYEILKYAIKNLPKLKRILIPISTFSFHVEVGKTGDKGPHARKYFYKHYTPINVPSEYFDDEKKNYSLLKYYFLFNEVQFNGLYDYYIAKEKSQSIDKNGFLLDNETLTLQELKQKAKISAKRHRLHLFGKEMPVFPYLIKILDLAQKHNIEVILYTTPHHDEYIKLIDPALLNTFFERVNETAITYDVPYYNYFHGAKHGYENEHFKDSDHLNGAGAKKFSETLDSLIISKLATR